MGVYEGRGQIAKGVKDLLNRWYETKSEWDDPMSQQIEKDYLVPLEIDLRSAVGAMEHIAHVLSQIRRDCGS
ncbi:MAG TPA: hypothetical protein VFC78_22485 [Tepidisphaeraceae bacterium]|nr:hypothetical protein [Tepidisphaeraceae bacterium]